MKIIVPKDEIVLIGLIYKYIATGKGKLTKYEASWFVDEVNKKIKMMDNCMCEICLDEEEFSSVLHLMYRDKVTEEYVLNEDVLLDYWYEHQPREIIHATLTENALSQINIKRSDLKIKQKYRRSYGTMGIYSLAEKSARESTRRILDEEGNKNIKITSSFLTTLDGGDVGYRVSYECDKLFENIDVSNDLVNVKKKQK